MDLDRHTLEALDWPYLLEVLSSYARTPAGRRQALALVPSADLTEVGELLNATEEVGRILGAGLGRLPLTGIEDIGECVERAARDEVLDLPELGLVAVTVDSLARLRRFLDEQFPLAPTLARHAASIDLDSALCSTLARAFDERGGLSEKTYPVLAELRQRIAGLERRIRGTLDALLTGGALTDVLQDRYVTIRGDRFVVPIKAQAKGLGLGIVHDSSRSGQTVYLEPAEVVPLGNQRRLAEAELVAEELRIRRELSRWIGACAPAITDAIAAAGVIDLAGARARLTESLQATRPQVGEEGTVELLAARHPVLVLEGTEVVANDLCATADRPVLVLTGPNAGGKTVALKTVGLCALLARVGCFVPAALGSRIDLFPDVLADIGDQQSVHGGLSSFSGHLANLRAMIERAGPGALLLLDEIASGTDPAQGGALARALIERMAGAGARVVATTHYAQVKGMAAADARVVVAAMEYRDERPTYRVVLGVAGESHALDVALAAGIEADIVERARTLMDEGERALADALSALERERVRAETVARTAAERTQAVAERERKLAAREARIQGRARDLEEQAAARFVALARDAEREIRRVVAELQQRPSHHQAERARAAVAETSERIAAHHAKAATGPSEPVQVGDRVRITRLGASGRVVALRGDEVEVRAGSLTIRVDNAEIERLGAAGDSEDARAREDRSSHVGHVGPREGSVEHPSKSSSRADDRSRAATKRTGRGQARPTRGPAAADLVRVDGNTLDLRGQRVEEALRRLDRFLDDAVIAGFDGVFVLHGHGTEALKKTVREVLARSPYVADHAPATDVQGGDAFTAVVLRG